MRVQWAVVAGSGRGFGPRCPAAHKAMELIAKAALMSTRQPTLGTSSSHRECEGERQCGQAPSRMHRGLVRVDAQIPDDAVVLGYHSTSTIEDCKVEGRATSCQVDGISHEWTSSEVKTSPAANLVRVVPSAGLGPSGRSHQDCEVTPETQSCRRSRVDQVDTF
jgi:hypothetical protein